jgi:hypothetical protein
MANRSETENGGTFDIHDVDIPDKSIAQYTFYGRGGGYGLLQIKDQAGRLLASHVAHLGPNDRFADSVVTGHFELPSGGIKVHLNYSSSCSCNFETKKGLVVKEVAKVVNEEERFIACLVYGAYDLQGDHDFDDAVVSISFTKK